MKKYRDPALVREYNRRYYLAHKAEIIANVTAWKAAHPEEVKKYNHRSYMRRKHGND